MVETGRDAIWQECQPVGYSFTDYTRQSGRVGGGTGLLCRSNLTPSLVRSGEKKIFEFSEWLIKCPSLTIRLIVVYRPTYSKEHPISPAIFNEEFGEYLQGVILSKEPLLITGDFNFHVDDCSDKDAAKFKDLLLEFGLQQHVNVPTHTDGHKLHLFINDAINHAIMPLHNDIWHGDDGSTVQHHVAKNHGWSCHGKD